MKYRLALAAIIAAASTSASHAQSLGFFDFIDAGDLDGDGSHDIVGDDFDLPAGSSSLLAVDGVDGTVLWKVPIAQGPEPFFKKALGAIDSIDGDAVPDIAYQTQGPSISLYSGANGALIEVVSIAQLNPADSNISPIAVTRLPTDLTADGIREIVIGSVKSSACVGGKNDTGFVYAVDPTNPSKPLWISKGPAGSYNFGWDITALAYDHDGDGVGDLLVTDHCRANPLGGGLFSKGAAYVVSSKSGAILKQIPNPTKQANPEFEGNILFGFDALETQDIDHDGVGDFFVSEVNFDASSGGQTAVDAISGKTGALICRYLSPAGGFDGFGASLAGGKFKFGAPANSVYSFFDLPHDLLVGAPDVSKAYVLRIDAKQCDAKPLLEVDGLDALGSRVGLLTPPQADPGQPSDGYDDLLIDVPLENGGVLDRYSGRDGSPQQTYVP